MNCTGCGVTLDPSEEQVNQTVDQVLQTSLKDAHDTGGVCPLCGHSKAAPQRNQPPLLLVLLIACLAWGVIWSIRFEKEKQARQDSVTADALAQMNANADVTKLLGKPVTALGTMEGGVKKDETGWQEARLTFPVHGPIGDGVARIAAGKMIGQSWKYSTFEVVAAPQHKKVDLLLGRVIEYDPKAYVDVHFLPAAPAEIATLAAPAPRIEASYPCVSATAGSGSVTPQLGSCALAPEMSGPVDRFETDLRYGRFVLRETDLYLNDVFQVPLTRTYNSQDWIHPNRVHAFGKNTNHPFDISPLGSRNPYTYQIIAMEDGDSLYFNRISEGTGYANAVYQHSDSATRFYKALQKWNGGGWTTTLADGSEIVFPESYNATNMAQGAPTEMRDAKGNKLELIRDGQRNLKEIRTPHGHWIRFEYDDKARIVRAEDDAGEWAQYTYNADGMLTAVVLSTGKERHFEYDGVEMTAVKDETGRLLVSNFYAYREIVGQRFLNGEQYSYSYARSGKRTHVDVAHITMPDGTPKDVATAKYVVEH